jgi:hypothetical protein
MRGLIQSFFDGFGPAGMFVRFEWPDAPTRVFAESSGIWAQQKEIVRDLLRAARAGRIVSAKRDAHDGRVESTFIYDDSDDLLHAGSTHKA